MRRERGLTSRIVETFLTSKLSVLFLLFSLAAGAAALTLTPREEEPQIVVPLADVLVSFPGASAEEVEKLVATPLEARLWEIDGVEFVYSASQPGQALVTVRFHVGEDRERSLVKIWNKVMSNQDALPRGVAGWVVKPVEIDDVPIVLVSLWSPSPAYGGPELRRIADELLDKLQRVPDTGKSWIVGGERRRVSVYLDPARLAARGLGPNEVVRALGAANVNARIGTFESDGRETVAEAGPFFATPAEVEGLVLGVSGGKAIHLRDVASVVDGPEEPESYTRIGFGPAAAGSRTIGGGAALEAARAGSPAGPERPQVTIAVAKRKGTNAVWIADEVIATVDGLRGKAIPPDVLATVTRDQGATANRKVNELVKHLLIAVATIVVLLAFALGPKESLIVAIAVPVTLAITLLLDYLCGYTINRVTLFALILSLGLLVDDPIVDVENIFRHFKLGRESPLEATLTAVEEVRPPTILATLTVIVSFLPMFFITGMAGPYMAPMAFNVPIAMVVSLIVAFTITPWATYRFLGSEHGRDEAPLDLARTRTYRVYRAVLGPLLRPGRGGLFLLAVLLAFVGASMLAVKGAVPLKMLPFDNKDELLLVVDTPEGTTLETTDALGRDLGRYLTTVAEVTDYETFAGLASPIDFNGLVRHYYLRRGGNVAEVRVNLLPKEERAQGSHEIALRIRPEVERIAARYTGAVVKIVESPPGPPVLATLTGEVYGPIGASHDRLIEAAGEVRRAFEATRGVVDVDDYIEAPRPKVRILVDREKAMLHGIAVAEVVQALQAALAGAPAGAVHVPSERLPLEIVVRLPRAARSSVQDLLLGLRLRAPSGDLVPLGEIARAEEDVEARTIYHKNLRRTAYVIAEVVGRGPVEAVFDIERRLKERPLPEGYTLDLAGEGEWKITLDMFRDLGIAFGAALVMIYVLLVAQTGSLGMPLVIMAAIPLTVIGIMPGFWLLNALFSRPVGPYATPIFFTATAMIGMIALAGIVVRNSIILIDFIEHLRARDRSAPLADVVIEAGATRTRPILLTAGAAMSGSFVITLDPIFSGLAWSLIFGIFASTAFSLVVVPVIYFLSERRRAEAYRP